MKYYHNNIRWWLKWLTLKIILEADQIQIWMQDLKLEVMQKATQDVKVHQMLKAVSSC